jgi:hypothetical protein
LAQRVPHIERRQELALLQIDDPSRLPPRDDEIVWRERTRNICSTSATSRDRRRLLVFVDVRQDRHLDLIADSRERRQPSLEAWPRYDVSDVRFALSKDALKMYGTPRASRWPRFPAAMPDHVVGAFDHAGPGNQHEIRPTENHSVAMRTSGTSGETGKGTADNLTI